MLSEIELFSRGKDWRTQASYRSMGKRLEKFLQDERLTLADLKPIDIKKFLYSAGTNKKGQLVMSSAQCYKRFVSALMRFLGRKRARQKRRIIALTSEFTA